MVPDNDTLWPDDVADNDSYSDTYEDFEFELPWWRQLIWTLLYAGMVVVATGGNLIVIWIVLAHKRMRTVTNYFLVNLSVADTMVSTLNVTFNYTFMLTGDWPFGTLYCKIVQFVSVLSVFASVFTLMAISIDRYMAIINPLKPRLGKRTTLLITGGIWMVAIIASIPNFLFHTTGIAPNNYTKCYPQWPDGETTASQLEYWYNVIFALLTYFMPIIAMTYTYSRIGVELWGSQSIGECTQRQVDNIKSKRRVVKMMIVVVTIFAVCWLPYQLYFIIMSHVPDITQQSYIQELFLFIYWLAMSNSMYNPIIYFWMNSRFRRGFKKFFSCFPCVHVSPETLSRQEVLTSRYTCSGSPDTQCSVIRNGSVHIPLHMRSDARGDSDFGGSQYSTFRAAPRWRNGDASRVS